MVILRSFAFMPREIDIGFYYDIWKEINGLKWYFYKFAGANAEDAMSRTIYHTLTHFNAEKGSLSAYIKKLAREITKENGKLVFVDFLEQTLSEDDDNPETSPTVQLGSIRDFSDDIIDEMEMSEDRKSEVVKLALEFMDKFLLLCDALKRRDTSTRYFPNIFIKTCLGIQRRCTNFNQLCFEVSEEYGDAFRWFLQLAQAEENWREADFTRLRGSSSKRMRFVNPNNGEAVEDADIDTFVFQGKLGTGDARKKIIKVDYYDVWELMCDLIDSGHTNEMKFVIGDYYIIRTFAGSVSVINPDLYGMYDLVRNEILTNVLADTDGKVLNVGSENFYLVCPADMQKQYMERTVHGHTFKLNYVDITDTILG